MHRPPVACQWRDLGVRDDFAHLHAVQRYRVDAANHLVGSLRRLIRSVLRVENDYVTVVGPTVATTSSDARDGSCT